MASLKFTCCAILFITFSHSLLFQSLANSNNDTSTLVVDAGSGKPISKYFFGVFFEEINHAGAGGLWAELVDNRGFEAGGSPLHENISPWKIIGDKSNIEVQIEAASLFPKNKIAVRLDIHCPYPAKCPNGVGLSNPGFWGMNIEKGKEYRVVFYLRALGPVNLKVAFTGADGKELASNNIKAFATYVVTWKKFETILKATASDVEASLQLTTNQKGVIWLDQVSAMPLDTHKGHGFRKDLFQKVADLKPTFLRFPGGCYVEGNYLRNAFRWKETIGPWETRPGHFNDMWGYWVDDGFGYLEFLQLSEDLGTAPIWVFNNGISHHDQVNTSNVDPMVQEALDGIEFARGPTTSRWGKLRASLGHPKPFDLRYVAIGNEDCEKENYQGNYLKFYSAIKRAYPDMQIISNCDATKKPLKHLAELYDYHIYTNAKDIFSMYTKFDNMPHSGPKAFVSEYAVWKEDAGNGTLLSALGEAAFLMGLEKNSEVVEMVSYAPLFVNTNDKRWLPDAIVFDSHQSYGTPSYYLQKLFSESSGAMYLNSTLQAPPSVVASAVTYTSSTDNKSYIRVKVVNFNNNPTTLKITFNGLDSSVKLSKATKTVLTSSNVKDENSFEEPTKIVLVQSPLENVGKDTTVTLPPNSITAFDFPN
ncbi:alpha-L-arabinofuranosidase 1-like [Prosopis cineraria]|uniref:alpha-L-arabinofuranosidase 1-like n=1 Tax=Prosopis cineraria TaxID=364024 RepID=UPI00240FA08A|nr:alpha-L-arabinofuranosidase 1-like [Prosopis cineraria]